MKRVRISIRLCGKTATANLLYVDSKGKQHKSVKQAEKEPGDTREAVELKAMLAGLQAIKEPGDPGNIRPGLYRSVDKKRMAGFMGGSRRKEIQRKRSQMLGLMAAGPWISAGA